MQPFVAARDSQLLIQNRQRVGATGPAKKQIQSLPQRDSPGKNRARGSPVDTPRFRPRNQPRRYAPVEQVIVTAQFVAHHHTALAPTHRVDKVQAHAPTHELPYGKLAGSIDTRTWRLIVCNHYEENSRLHSRDPSHGDLRARAI